MLCKKMSLSSMVLFVLVCIPLIDSVMASSVFWSHTYGGSCDEETGFLSNDRAHSLVETSDGGYALAGRTNSFGTGSTDFWLVKTDASGNMEWNQTYGGTEADIPYALVETSDGGYALAGETLSFFDGWDYYFCLVKTDANGVMEWNRTYIEALNDFARGPRSDSARALVETSDGGYAIAGYISWNDVGSPDCWLVKTDASGNEEWNRTYGGTQGDAAYSLVATSDGGYAIAGRTNSFGAGFTDDFWLVKTDSSGNVEWNQTYGGTGRDIAHSVVKTSDGGYAIAGDTDSFGAGKDDFWLVKTDEFGNMEWNRTYGGNYYDHAYSLVETSDGGYALAGNTNYFFVGPSNEGVWTTDCWLVKTDATGNMEWNRTYKGPYGGVAHSLVATSDGGYALAGFYAAADFDLDYDFWLIKTDETGYVPEYSSWLLPPLLLIATLVIIIYKKRLVNQRS